jgi:putative DNA primase/helicase
MIDVAELKTRINIVDVVGSYITLKKVGKEYKGLCPFHADTNPSFYVIPEKGFCHCFSCGWPNGKSGDVIAFIEDMESLDFNAACERLGAKNDWQPRITAPVKAKIPDRITSKPPLDAPTPDFTLRDLGAPSHIWPYRDSDGSLLGYVTRHETTNGSSRKEYRPWTWGARGEAAPAWGQGIWNKPRPLYRLDALAERPTASVLVTEGEKAADAAQRLLPGYVACTWPGGAQAWKTASWEALRGRKVLLWPDADLPGWEAMQALARVLSDPRGLSCAVRIVDTNRQPEGWDLADAETEKWTTEQVIAWAKERASDFNPVAPAERPSESAEQATPPAISPPVATGPIPQTALDSESPPLDAYEITAEAAAAQHEPPDGDDPPLPPSMSEDAIADAFAAQHEDHLRFVKQWNQWFMWEGNTWKQDMTEKVDRLAVEICRQATYWNEAKTLSAAVKCKIASRRVAGAVRDTARNDRRLACGAENWDADPLLVGLPEGVFDVRTDQIITGSREHYITKRVAVMPQPGTPIKWLAHLERMMGGDQDMIQFLQLWCGYNSTADTSEQCFVFLYGQGQTGKGTFLLTMGDLLGDYTRYASASTFMAAENERHLSELARLVNCRAVIIDETDGTKRWNEERIKRVTGGGKLTANFMRENPFDFPITFKLSVAGNHKPALRGVGKEMERRIRLVRCDASIPDEEVDRNFRANLIATEGPQILNWILQGAVQWHQSRLPLPERIADATREYLQTEDLIADWLLECCDQTGTALRPDAHKSFCAWLEKRGDRAWSSRAWWSALEDRGYSAQKRMGAWMVKGLSLKGDYAARRDEEQG